MPILPELLFWNNFGIGYSGINLELAILEIAIIFYQDSRIAILEL
jgi:hypothetical protein